MSRVVKATGTQKERVMLIEYKSEKLRGLVKSHGLNLTRAGKIIGCNRDTMARKLSLGGLTVSELTELAKSIPLSTEEFLLVWGVE